MTNMRAAILALMIFFPLMTIAQTNVAEFETAEQTERYQKLIAELRCLVCQNQNLADSNAELANDLKNIVQKKILDGESDAQILEFMTQRYGDFVLYRPPFKASTLLLWTGPLLFFLIGFFIVRAYIRRTRASTVTVTEQERARIRQLLETKNPE